MGFLDQMGLGPKSGRRPRRRGMQLERGRARRGPLLGRRQLALRTVIVMVLIALAALAFPRVTGFVASDVDVGEVWTQTDLVSPVRFPVLFSQAEQERRQDSVRAEVEQIFTFRDDALDQSLERLVTIDARLDEVFEAYARYRDRRSAGVDAREDSLAFVDVRQSTGLELSDAQWAALVDSWAAQAGGLETTTRAVDRTPLDDELVRRNEAIMRELLSARVLDIDRDSIWSEFLAVRDQERFVESTIPTNSEQFQVLGIDEAVAFARSELAESYAAQPDTLEIGMTLFGRSFVPNYTYRPEQTQEALEIALSRLPPQRGLVEEGEIIVRQNDRVTSEIAQKIFSLNAYQTDRSGDIGQVRTYTGRVMLVIAGFTVFFLYLFLLRSHVFADERSFLMIGLLFGVVLLGFILSSRFELFVGYAVPVTLVSVLLAVLFDSRVGLIGTVALAIIGGLVLDSRFVYTFATVFAGTLAVFSVRDIKNRAQLFVTAGLVLGAYVFVLLGFSVMRLAPLENMFDDVIGVLIQSLMMLFAYPLLWVFERVFGVTTDLTLLELSDTNRDLLKQLSLRAPGTFNHVLQVANLAEAASDAVGANALLARVGALYHDVGKMRKPEYFIENQQRGDNPHDRVSPHMSALIIGSHVKDGVELGREYKLPQKVLDFIPTHHGSSLMEYFYRKAQAQRSEGEPPVEEAEFRYPGPRPQTTEQGIVMLADSIEAASRSLDKPTPKRLESLIDAIFRARSEDGQLSNTGLTFSDLSKVKETFLSILSGIHHFRVKYPDQDTVTGETSEPDPPETARLPEGQGQIADEDEVDGPDDAPVENRAQPSAQPPAQSEAAQPTPEPPEGPKDDAAPDLDERFAGDGGPVTEEEGPEGPSDEDDDGLPSV